MSTVRARLAAGVIVAALALLAPASAGAVSFSGPSKFGAGDHPASVAVGDFGGDSNPDLAVANQNSNTACYHSRGTIKPRRLVAPLVASGLRTACSSHLAGIFNTSAALRRTSVRLRQA